MPRWVRWLQPLLSGVFTVDNLDYVRRDAYLTGVAIGPVDVERLRRYTFISERGLTLFEPGLPALEMFLTSRRFIYQQVYFHRTVRAIDLDLGEVFGPSIRAIFGDGSPGDRLAAYADLDEYGLLHQAARWARGEAIAERPGTGRRDRDRSDIADGWQAILLRQPTWRSEAEIRAEYEAGRRPEALIASLGAAEPGRVAIDLAEVDARPADAASTDGLLALETRDGGDPVALGGARLDPGLLAHRPALPPSLRRESGRRAWCSRRARASVVGFGRGGSTSSGSTRSDLGARQLHPLGDAALDRDLAALERAEQAVVEVAAGRVAGPALVAEEVAGTDALAALDDDLLEVGVHAPVAVAVVDHDHDRERLPQLLGVEPLVVAGQVAEPADGVVEVAAGGEDDAVVGGHDPVAAERREVDAVVERPAVDDPRGVQRGGAEGLGEPALRERPAVARQAGDRRRRRRGAPGARRDGRGSGATRERWRSPRERPGLGRRRLDGAGRPAPIGVIGPGASMEPVPTEPTVMSATTPSATGRTSRAPRER